MIGFIGFILLDYFFFNIAADFILVNVTSRESFLPTRFESDGPSSQWAKVRKLVCTYSIPPPQLGIPAGVESEGDAMEKDNQIVRINPQRTNSF